MKSRPVVTFAAGFLGLLLAGPARALTITLDPAAPGLVGQSQSFHVAKTAEAVGQVTLSWQFGDGESAPASPDLLVKHTYAAVGHYTVIVLASDDSTRTSATFIETIYAPATAKAPSNSSSIILDADKHRLWNVNADSDSVTLIDGDNLTRLREIPVGKEPRALAQAPDGSIWVTNQMSDEVVVLDPGTGAILTRIPLAYASQPYAVAFGPTGKAYVTLFATGKLVEIDAATRRPIREVNLGPTAAGVSVAGDGRIFVTRFLSPVDHGEVWRVSPVSLLPEKTIVLAFDQGPDTQSSGRGVPNYVSSIVISPDGTQAWVSAKKDDVARGIQRDGLPMNSDNFVRPAVCVIDLATEEEVIAKRQDIDNRSTPVSVAFSALGDYAFVLVQPSNWVGIVDGYTAQLVSGIRNVGNAPDGLAMGPASRLFVSAFLSREVIAYDVSASLSSADHIAPDPMARIRTIDHEPLSAQLLLGKQIYYNSADTRMGHAGYWSCASCHFQGFSDGRVWDFTDRGEGLRNTKSLLGIRGAQGQGRVHWSANMDEIQDFERDIRESFDGSGFMSDAEFNSRLGPDGIYDALGKPAAGVSPDLDALSAYITSFDKVPRSPFRNPDGSFTAAALEGRKIFAKAGCPACHSGPDFTDSPSGVLHDVGTIATTSGFRLGKPLTGLDTPTLKGLWMSAPYLHDGRAVDLMEVFTKYNKKDLMGVTSDLSQTELQQMVEYLLELDDVPEPAANAVPTPVAGSGSSSRGHGCSVAPHATAGLAATGLAALGALGMIALRRRRVVRRPRARRFRRR
jgi:MYXO-CTERM domain-containing protein